jgi:hypothetical protein
VEKPASTSEVEEVPKVRREVLAVEADEEV